MENQTREHVREHHLIVPRTARYYTLGTLSVETRDVWIVCHGYAQLASRFIENFRDCLSDSRFIVAPEALSRFYLDSELPHTPKSRVGALWMTREDREAEIGDIVSYLDTLYEAILNQLSEYGIHRDHIRVHVLGFSQGAAAVSRWVARGNARIDHLVLWGTGAPDDVNLRAVRDRLPELMVDFVYGSEDKWVSEEVFEAQKARFEGANLRHRVVTFPGGHVIQREALERVFQGGQTD
jgi:predicted esterase